MSARDDILAQVFVLLGMPRPPVDKSADCLSGLVQMARLGVVPPNGIAAIARLQEVLTYINEPAMTPSQAEIVSRDSVGACLVLACPVTKQAMHIEAGIGALLLGAPHPEQPNRPTL